MSKMLKARNSAAAASEPLRQQVQTEAQLQEQIRLLAESMAKLSDESRSTVAAMLGRMAEAQNAINSATAQANSSAATLNAAVTQTRGRLLLAALAGWLAGVLSLLALLLWQPRPLLAALWNAAKALGTTQ